MNIEIKNVEELVPHLINATIDGETRDFILFNVNYYGMEFIFEITNNGMIPVNSELHYELARLFI